MRTYKGSCHCGLIAFEVRKPRGIEVLIDCNCSICSKKGLIHTPVENDELVILSGENRLAHYQFGTKTASYWFCPQCGVEPFHRSRGNPQRYSVNARCLDDFYDILKGCGLWFIEARDHPMDRGSDQYTTLPNPYRANEGSLPEFVDAKSPFKLRKLAGACEDAS